MISIMQKMRLKQIRYYVEQLSPRTRFSLQKNSKLFNCDVWRLWCAKIHTSARSTSWKRKIHICSSAPHFPSIDPCVRAHINTRKKQTRTRYLFSSSIIPTLSSSGFLFLAIIPVLVNLTIYFWQFHPNTFCLDIACRSGPCNCTQGYMSELLWCRLKGTFSVRVCIILSARSRPCECM